MLMFRKDHEYILSQIVLANSKVEAQLHDKIEALKLLLEDSHSQLEQARAKIDRMELVLMPLSSAAGAQYTRSLGPQAERKPPIMLPRKTDWMMTLENHMKAMAEEEAQEKVKEKANGTQGK